MYRQATSIPRYKNGATVTDGTRVGTILLCKHDTSKLQYSYIVCWTRDIDGRYLPKGTTSEEQQATLQRYAYTKRRR